MICINCGNEVPAGYKFCPSCGAPISENASAAVSPTPTPYQFQQPTGYVDERQYTMQTLHKVTSYFYAESDKYELFHKLAAEVQDRSHKRYVSTWILTGIVFVIYRLAVFSLDHTNSYLLQTLGVILGFVCMLGSIVLGIISLVYIPLFIKNKKRLPIARKELDDVGHFLVKYYKDFGYCPVAFEYTDPVILTQIDSIIISGRASNFPGAFAVLKQDMQDAAMLKQATRAANAAERSAAAAEDIAASARQTARSAKEVADYASLSFWLD